MPIVVLQARRLDDWTLSWTHRADLSSFTYKITVCIFYNPYLKVIEKSMFAHIVNNTWVFRVDSAEIIMCFFLTMYIRI